MPDPQPPAQPPQQPSSGVDKSTFREWMAEYERERAGANPPPSGGTNSSDGPPSVEAAVEAALKRREDRSTRDKRFKDLEDANATLAKEVEGLKELVKKGARGVFSIFS